MDQSPVDFVCMFICIECSPGNQNTVRVQSPSLVFLHKPTGCRVGALPRRHGEGGQRLSANRPAAADQRQQIRLQPHPGEGYDTPMASQDPISH